MITPDELAKALGELVARNEIGPQIEEAQVDLRRIRTAINNLPRDIGRAIDDEGSGEQA